MNFAARLARNQRFNLARAAEPHRGGPDDVLGFFLERLSTSPYDFAPYNELRAYLGAGSPWTGSAAQLRAKTAGLVKLIVGSSNYQFV